VLLELVAALLLFRFDDLFAVGSPLEKRDTDGNKKGPAKGRERLEFREHG
jgi:hypothetical protein